MKEREIVRKKWRQTDRVKRQIRADSTVKEKRIQKGRTELQEERKLTWY